MDPLTAFSLAVTVIQFVVFTSKLISTTRQIAAEGARSDYLDIKQQTLGFTCFLEDLQPRIAIDPVKASQGDHDLWELCRQGQEIAERMLKVLQGCHSDQASGKVSLDIFVRAVKSKWHHAGLQELQAKLDQISLRAQPFIVRSNHIELIQKLSKLEALLQELGADRSANLRGLQEALEELRHAKNDTSDHSRVIRRLTTGSGLAPKGHDYMVEAGVLEQMRFKDIDRRLQQLEQRPAYRKSYLWMHESDQQNSTKVEHHQTFILGSCQTPSSTGLQASQEAERAP